MYKKHKRMRIRVLTPSIRYAKPPENDDKYVLKYVLHGKVNSFTLKNFNALYRFSIRFAVCTYFMMQFNEHKDNDNFVHDLCRLLNDSEVEEFSLFSMEVINSKMFDIYTPTELWIEEVYNDKLCLVTDISFNPRDNRTQRYLIKTFRIILSEIQTFIPETDFPYTQFSEKKFIKTITEII